MHRRRMPYDRAPKAGEIYFEHFHLGGYAKVAAIDAATGTEVSIMGPASADPRMLEEAALRKLQARLKRDPRTG